MLSHLILPCLTYRQVISMLNHPALTEENFLLALSCLEDELPESPLDCEVDSTSLGIIIETFLADYEL